jgi:hypothetical protein
MNNLAQAIWVEMLKARRSKMPLLTTLGFSVFPLALGFFMFVLKDPELARRYWLITDVQDTQKLGVGIDDVNHPKQDRGHPYGDGHGPRLRACPKTSSHIDN